MVLCNFCKKDFLNEYKLQRHQKTAKYCLEIQQRKKSSITCEVCEKKFFSDRELKAHICKSLIIKLKQEIDELRNEINELKKSRKIIIKNKFELKPLTDEIFKELNDKILIEDILKGPYGLADFAVINIFSNRAICSDISRFKIRYRNENNELCADYKMINLCVRFFSSIKEKAIYLINLSCEENKKSFTSGEMTLIEEDDFYEDMSRIYELKTMIKEGSEGIENSKVQDFVKIVCSKILPRI